MAAGAKSAKLTSSLLQAGAARLRGGPANSPHKGKISIDPPPVPPQKQLVLDADDWLRPRAGKFDYSEKPEVPQAEGRAATPFVDPDELPTYWLKYDGLPGIKRPPPSIDATYTAADSDSDESSAAVSWTKYPLAKVPSAAVLPGNGAVTSGAETPAHDVAQDKAPALVPAATQEAPAESPAPPVMAPPSGEFAVLSVEPTFSSLYAAWHREHRAVAAALTDLGRSADPATEAPIKSSKLSAPMLLALSHANDAGVGSYAEPAFDPLLAALEKPAEAVPDLVDPEPVAKANAEVPREILTLAVPLLLPPAGSERGLGAPVIGRHFADLSRLRLGFDIEGEAKAEMPTLSVPSSLPLWHVETEPAPPVTAPSFDPLTALAEPVEAEVQPPRSLSPTIVHAALPEMLTLAAPTLLPPAVSKRSIGAPAIGPYLSDLSRFRLGFDIESEAEAEMPTLSMPGSLTLWHEETEAASSVTASAFDPLTALAEPLEAEASPPRAPSPAIVDAAPEMLTLAAPDPAALAVEHTVVSTFAGWPALADLQSLSESEARAEPSAFVKPGWSSYGERDFVPFENEPTFDPLLAALEQSALAETEPQAPSASETPTREPEASPRLEATDDALSRVGAQQVPAMPVAEPASAPLATTSEPPWEAVAESALDATSAPEEPSRSENASEASVTETATEPAPREAGAEPASPSSDVELLVDALRTPKEEAVPESPLIASDRQMAGTPQIVPDITSAPALPAEPEASTTAVVIEAVIESVAPAAVVDAAETEVPPADVQLLLDTLREPATPVTLPPTSQSPAANEEPPEIAPVAQEQPAEPEASPVVAEMEPATDPRPISDDVNISQPAAVSEEAQLLPPASHEPSALPVEPSLGPAPPPALDLPTEIDPLPEPVVTPLAPEPAESPGKLDVAVSEPTVEVELATAPPVEGTASPPAPDVADDVEADPRAEHRAAVAALAEQLTSVIGSVLDSKDYAALPNLRPRTETEAKPKISRSGPLRPSVPANDAPPNPAAVVTNLPQKQVSPGRSWARMAMAASSAIMIIAAGFVALGLGGAPRASTPIPVRTEAATVPAPVLPDPPPIAAIVQPEEHAQSPASSEPANDSAKLSSHKLRHAKRNPP